MLLLLPYFGGLVGILFSDRESSATWIQAETVAGMSFSSLVLSLVTMIGLAGSAFAAEHEDRASEFLACLPTARWMGLSSKVLMITAAVVSIGLVNLIPLFFLKPHLSTASGLGGELSALRFLAPIGPLLFGVA